MEGQLYVIAPLPCNTDLLRLLRAIHQKHGYEAAFCFSRFLNDNAYEYTLHA